MSCNMSDSGDASDGDSPAKSPCMGNCCLDDELTCLGCFRSLEEIKEWGVVDNQRRRIILQNATRRSEAAAGRYGDAVRAAGG